jgi:hypothetical protein
MIINAGSKPALVYMKFNVCDVLGVSGEGNRNSSVVIR